MPITPIKYRIKDLNQLTQESDLINKIFEVESTTGADTNHKVSFATVVQAVNNNSAGGNNSKVAVKTARTYSTTTPGYSAGDETLTGLNPDFLCLYTTCWVEFPHPTTQYILVYDGTSNPALVVWRDGDFTGQKIGARWVPVDSIEAQLQNISDFSPFTFSYNQGDNVKFTLDGKLRLFAAKTNLVKSTFTPQQIPVPTGLSTDQYWQEIAAGNRFGIPDYLPGSYKRHDVVYQLGKIYRANQDYIVGDYINNPADYDNFPDLDYWQVIAGGTTPTYDDAPLTARVATLENTTDNLSITLDDNFNELSTAISNIHSIAKPWLAGSYVAGELVRYNNIVFVAKQDMQNSQVPPATTNAYWLQVGTSTVNQNSLSPASTTIAPTVDAVNQAINDVYDEIAGVNETANDALTKANDLDTRVDNLEVTSFIDFRQEVNVTANSTFPVGDGISYTISGNATMQLPPSINSAGVLFCLRVPSTGSSRTITVSIGTLDNGIGSFTLNSGEWRIIKKAPSPSTSSSYYTILKGGNSGVDESNLVHKTGNETISGTKTFTNEVDINNILAIGDGSANNSLRIRKASGAGYLDVIQVLNSGLSDSVNIGAIGQGGNLRMYGQNHIWLAPNGYQLLMSLNSLSTLTVNGGIVTGDSVNVNGNVTANKYLLGADGKIDFVNGNLILSANGTADFAITGDGVGIGTTSPDEALHVTGNVKARYFIGNVVFADGSEQTTSPDTMYEVPSSVRSAVSGAMFSSGETASVSGTVLGQKFFDASYRYEAMLAADNLTVRWIRQAK